MTDYMKAFGERVKRSRSIVEKFKEVVWLAEKCEVALVEDANAFLFGEKEYSSSKSIKNDFAQLAYEEYNMSIEDFNDLRDAVSFLNNESLEYC